MADDLVVNGTVSPQNVEEFYFDQSMGSISEILVTNNQEIKKDTVVLAYQNETVQDQVDEQQQSLDKLNLAVYNAQQNLDNTYNKRQELQNSLTEAIRKQDQADNKSLEGQAIQQEEQIKVDQYKEAISSQEDAILQAQQALETTNLDLSSVAQLIEKAKNKVTTNIIASVDGIAIVNEKGKTDPSIPTVKVISKETIINAKVSEYDYFRLAKDQSVKIHLINDNKEFDGTITEINKLPITAEIASDTNGENHSEIANYSFKVKPSDNLQYGYSCQVSIPINELRIPSKVILKEKEQQYVFVYSNGKVKKTFIETENHNGVYIVIKGLKEKDQVISNPTKDLKDNQEVMVN